MNRTIKKEKDIEWGGIEKQRFDRSTGQVNKGHLVTNTYTLLMFIFSQETNLFFKGLS